jgi:hypothetical protein
MGPFEVMRIVGHQDVTKKRKTGKKEREENCRGKRCSISYRHRKRQNERRLVWRGNSLLISPRALYLFAADTTFEEAATASNSNRVCRNRNRK